MPELDILYMTRVQRERFFNEEDYLRLKDSYILTPEKLKNAKPDLRILHPLPRVNEISVAVDDDPRACYFKQVQYGKYIRMALILKLLDIAEREGIIMIIDSIQNGIVIDHISRRQRPWSIYKHSGPGRAGLHRGHHEERHQRQAGPQGHHQDRPCSMERGPGIVLGYVDPRHHRQQSSETASWWKSAP